MLLIIFAFCLATGWLISRPIVRILGVAR